MRSVNIVIGLFTAILHAHRALLLSGYTYPTQYYIRHYNAQIYGASKTKSNIRIHRQSQLAAPSYSRILCDVVLSNQATQIAQKPSSSLTCANQRKRVPADARLPGMMIPSNLVSTHAERDAQSFWGCKCCAYEWFARDKGLKLWRYIQGSGQRFQWWF